MSREESEYEEQVLQRHNMGELPAYLSEERGEGYTGEQSGNFRIPPDIARQNQVLANVPVSEQQTSVSQTAIPTVNIGAAARYPTLPANGKRFNFIQATTIQLEQS